MPSCYSRLLVWLLLLVPAQAARAEPFDEGARLAQRLATRQEVLEGQKDGAEARVHEQALLAYRLTRRRALGFMSSPESRREDAEASDLALTSLGKSFFETRTLVDELAHVRAERVALDRARGQRVDALADAGESLRRFARPVRGAMVGVPGIRRDGPTGTKLCRDGIELLARLNEPVRAVAAGVIRRVENLPQGGYAVVTQHPARWVSVLSGLRGVVVAPGEPVEPGQVLGLAGRNLDGAAVISFELWRNRQSVDPRDAVVGLPRR
ncbi:MAG TPA: M23 family metallopeptidase [Polyangia bacterium]|jgi:Membrane proteins related to metalloendopeptidases|nr:M23 family metallopeptidase [Polyangia bacterium]